MRFQDDGDKRNAHSIPTGMKAILEAQKRAAERGDAPPPPQTKPGINPAARSSFQPGNQPQQVDLNESPDGIRPPQFGIHAARNADGTARQPAKPQPPVNNTSPDTLNRHNRNYDPAPKPSQPARQPDAPPEPVAAGAGEDFVKTRTAKPKSATGPSWRRYDFPSNLVPYNFDEIFVRGFMVPDLAAVYDSIERQNHTGYLDALDECLSVDIRDLTVPDFIFAQYIIRMSSYPRSPYTVKWTSRYGNDLKQRLTPPDLQLMYLNMSKDEYKQWVEKGICFPTVRESEYIINSGPMPDPVSGERDSGKDGWIMQNAQYLMLPPDAPLNARMEQKIELFNSLEDPDILIDIQQFALKCQHGVIETIECQDDAFEPVAAITFLKNSASQLRRLVEGLMADNPAVDQIAGIMRLTQAVDSYESEAVEIEQAVKDGRAYVPRKETIALRTITPMDMFPLADTESAT